MLIAMDRIRLFFKYFKEAKRYAWLLVTAFFSDLTISMLTMLLPLFSIVIFDYAYPNRDLRLFTYLILTGLIIYFIDNFFSGSIDYVNLYIDQQMGLKFSQNLFSKIQKMPIYQLKRGDIGSIIVNLTDDISQVTDLLTGFFSVLLTNIAKLGFFLYVILKIDYRITVLALLSVPLYIIETKFLSDKLEDTQKGLLKAESNIINFIQERLINLRTIKAFSRQ